MVASPKKPLKQKNDKDFLRLTRMEKIWVWTNLLYMLRVPILLGLIVFLLPVYARWLAKPFLGGLFDFFEKPFWMSFWFAFFTFNFAWSIMAVSKIILFYGLRRIGTDEKSRGWFTEYVKPKLMEWKVAFYICLVFGIFCVSGAFWVIPANLKEPNLVWMQILGLVCGFLLSFFALFLADAAQSLFYKPGESDSIKNFLFPYRVGIIEKLQSFDVWETKNGKWFYDFLHKRENLVSRLFLGIKEWFQSQEIVSRGYFRKAENGGKGASSHVTAFALFLVFLAVYFIVGYGLIPGRFYIPAVAYLPILMGGLCWLLANISFFFDSYRIPLVVPLLIWFFIASWGQGHYYNLYESAITDNNGKTTESQQTDQDYIIVVTADGGGIQAAAWTAKVLTEIEKECGGSCSKKTRLISSVSGGSVGAMYYLDAFDEQEKGLPSGELEEIVKRAKASSLNGVSYGLAYSDFINSINPITGWTGLETSDRGYALQNAWQRNRYLRPEDRRRKCTNSDSLDGLNCPLSDWKKGVEQGWRPAIVFNGTVVETGERFLITNSKRLDEHEKKDLNGNDQDGKRSFYKMFGKDNASIDMPIATAARISASYPYVSPVVRPRGSGNYAINDERSLHVADGGYYDNYGISSAMDWMQLWIDERSKSGGKQPKIIVVQIICGDAGFQSPPAKREGWFLQTFAPLFTLYNVRVAGQRARADTELELFEKSNRDKVEIVPVKFNFTDGMRKVGRPETEPPLSWHLTEKEKHDIDEAWKGSGDALKEFRNAVNPNESGR